MHDEDFRSHRDVYNNRAKRDAPEMCWYWAWGQTRYTVHLAMWLASEDHDADIQFSGALPSSPSRALSSSVALSFSPPRALSSSPPRALSCTVTEDGKQRIRVVPNGQQELLDRVFAHAVNTSRSGEAFTFGHMHCMTFVMLKVRISLVSPALHPCLL